MKRYNPKTKQTPMGLMCEMEETPNGDWVRVDAVDDKSPAQHFWTGFLAGVFTMVVWTAVFFVLLG